MYSLKSGISQTTKNIYSIFFFLRKNRVFKSVFKTCKNKDINNISKFTYIHC